MEWLIIAAVAIAILLITIIEKKSTANIKCKRPLTEREGELYRILTAALPDKIILSQVAFHRFLYTTGNKKDRWRLFNRFKQKAADFLICNKEFYIDAIVELDDKSHRAERDRERDSYTQKAGLKTIRYKELPSIERIKEDFKNLSKGKVQPEPSLLEPESPEQHGAPVGRNSLPSSSSPGLKSKTPSAR